jgi:hypothetical protein
MMSSVRIVVLHGLAPFGNLGTPVIGGIDQDQNRMNG